MNVKYLAKKKELVKTLIPSAIAIMEAEYPKPIGERVKLTHVWLAEQLQVPRGVAFAVLAQVAYRCKLCVRLPEGAIYWFNDPITVGVVMDAIAKTDVVVTLPRYDHRRTKLFILANNKLRDMIKAHGLVILRDIGKKTIVRDGKDIAKGSLLSVIGERGAFTNLLSEVKEFWTTNNHGDIYWEKQTYDGYKEQHG